MLHYLTLVAMAAGVLFGVLLVRQFASLGWLAISLFVLSAYDWSGYTELANMGGIAIYPADVLALVLAGAIVATPGALSHLRSAETWIWGTLIAVLAISLVRGVSAFGLGVAANEFRGLFQLIAVTLWAWGRMRLPGFDRALYRWTLLTGLGLSMVMVWHITQRGLGQVDQIITLHGQDVTSRPLVSGQALVLGLLGLAMVVRERSARQRVTGLAFFGLAALCQHRTVWIALVAAVVALVLTSSEARRRVLPWAFVVGVVLLMAYAAGVFDPLIAKFSLAYSSRGTLDDRISAFRTLIDEQNRQGSTAVMLGQPFGGGYVRRGANGTVETFAPHNYYVLLYLRIGLIGVTMWIVALLRGLWISVTRHDPRAIGWSAAVITYCLAYGLSLYMGPILAVALTAAPRLATALHTKPKASLMALSPQ